MSTYQAEMPKAVQNLAKPALQSSHGAGHSESYYDKESSHYMGGAHNVAIANIRKGLQPKLQSGHSSSYYDQSSSHYMGGAHNVAL